MNKIIDIIYAIILGIIEGITEWIPVSSTGHLILFKNIANLNWRPEFWDLFEVIIQFGAIIAVIILFWNKLWPFSMNKEEHYIKKDIWSMWFKVMTSCIPVIIYGLLFDGMADDPIYISISLIIVGIIFILLETLKQNNKNKVDDIKDITYKTAFIIGLFQLVSAIFPGVSRSGATIIGALLLGVTRKTSAEYTFSMAVPVMFGASILEIFKSFKILSTITSFEWLLLGISSLIAFLISLIVIKKFMKYIRKKDFKVFGYYRILLGLIIIVYFLIIK